MLTAMLAVALLQLLLFALCFGTDYLDRAHLHREHPDRTLTEATPSAEAFEVPLAA